MARAGRGGIQIPSYIRRRFFDHPVVEQTYNRGIVRDSTVPVGGVYDAVDFLVEKPGILYKRGGWERHSAAAGTGPLRWVGTLQVPVRVVTIDNTGNLYDVTSESLAGATLIGSVGFWPMENSPVDVDRIILTDPNLVHPPKYVRYNPTADALQIHDLENSPPVAAYSAVYSSGIVLGSGPNDYVNDYMNRLYFEPQGADIRAGRTNWDTTIQGTIDATYQITALASVGSFLLVFSQRHVQRLSGDTPPSVSNVDGNMSLGLFLNVGCVDARSICPADEGIIFAGEDGVWWTNGSSVRSLTEKDDQTGIQSYWRSMFPRFSYADHTSRAVVGGMISRDFYIVCVNDTQSNVNIDTLLCHVPSASWTRVSNFHVNSLQQGTDEEQVSELYMAEADTNFVSRASRIVYPSTRNMSDGNGVPVQPTYTTRNMSNGPEMKSYGYGWLTYKMTVPQGSLASWAATHTYALNDLIFVTYARSSFGDPAAAVFKATTGGTSGAAQPNWNSAYAAGMTVSDGTVVWTNQGPSLSVHGLSDVGRWQQTPSQGMAASGVDTSLYVVRKRFQLFRETQAIWMQITQSGYSNTTEIYFLEIEERIFHWVADSVGR